MLADREEVRQRLARMLEVREGVDHRDRGGGGEDLQPLLLEGPEHDRVDVAGQDATGVLDRLARGRAGARSRTSTTACAPSCSTPTSNETRVRVEGFSKISATDRPASARACAARSAFRAAARSRRSGSSAVERSSTLR